VLAVDDGHGLGARVDPEGRVRLQGQHGWCGCRCG
jgi:hypothetical protein